MSYMLTHLTNGWQVDQAILSEEERVVVLRFGHDWDPTCMKMDETLHNVAEKIKLFAVTYVVRYSVNCFLFSSVDRSLFKGFRCPCPVLL